MFCAVVFVALCVVLDGQATLTDLYRLESQLTTNLSPKTSVYNEVLYYGINEAPGPSVWR